MDWKLCVDLLPRQLGICSPEHFYGTGLNLELVLCVQSLVCGTGDCAQGLVKRLGKHSTTELHPSPLFTFIYVFIYSHFIETGSLYVPLVVLELNM